MVDSLEYIQSLIDGDGHENWVKNSYDHNSKFPVLRILSSALLVISEQGGYISQQKSKKTGQQSTAYEVREMLIAGKRTVELDANEQEAQKVLDWGSNKNYIPDGLDPNYWHDVGAQLACKDSNKIGLVASAIYFYNQKFTRELYKDLIKNSKYIGELKKRTNFFAKLLNKIAKNDQNGTSDGYYIYKIITREGDYAFFFNKNDYPVEVGDCFLFRGTVIGHDICKFEKVPTTKFNNVRFLENHGQPSTGA